MTGGNSFVAEKSFDANIDNFVLIVKNLAGRSAHRLVCDGEKTFFAHRASNIIERCTIFKIISIDVCSEMIVEIYLVFCVQTMFFLRKKVYSWLQFNSAICAKLSSSTAFSIIIKLLGFICVRAKAKENFFFDLCRCSM